LYFSYCRTGNCWAVFAAAGAAAGVAAPDLALAGLAAALACEKTGNAVINAKKRTRGERATEPRCLREIIQGLQKRIDD
jgi:hypothetical protein